MAENTKIEWTDHSWNPWKGCQKVGPGGVLLAGDMPHLWRATARDAGVTVDAVKHALGVPE